MAEWSRVDRWFLPSGFRSRRARRRRTDPGRVHAGSELLTEGYGYQWWLPSDGGPAFSAVGVYNQCIYVDPSLEITVVKLSANRAYGTTVEEAQNREGETDAFLRHCAEAVAS